jgi:hypothetical protein
MLGKYKFRKGQRVRPSEHGKLSHIFPKTRHDQSGIIVSVDEFGTPKVLWDGRKHPIGYHPVFIDFDRRRRAP